MFYEKAAGFSLNDLKYFWSFGPCWSEGRTQEKCTGVYTTTWWCKQHNIGTEEETDLQQNPVERTRAPDMLYLFAFGEKIKHFPATDVLMKFIT